MCQRKLPAIRYYNFVQPACLLYIYVTVSLLYTQDHVIYSLSCAWDVQRGVLEMASFVGPWAYSRDRMLMEYRMIVIIVRLR